MKKYILFILICCLFVVSDIAAGGVIDSMSGGNDARLFYLPRNVANNRNVMIELSQAHTVSVNDISDNYTNFFTGNYNILRLRNNLYQNGQAVPNGVTITIKVKNDDWSFINENNPTQKVSFGLNAFCVERKFDNRSYDTKVNKFDVADSESTTAPSMITDGIQYQLFMPYTNYKKDDWSMFSEYIREYDLCVLLPNTSENVETGYYSTTLTLESTYYYEHTAQADGQRVTTMERDSSTKKFSETITIRGYVGLEPGTNSGNCSFSVSSTVDTYSMDLSLKNTQSEPYMVANVDLQSIGIVSNTKPAAATQIEKYTVYISPTSDYTVGGSYRFIRMNSENQSRTDENTIYYDLYIKPENTYVKLSSLSASGSRTGTYSNYNTNNEAKNTSYKIGNAFALNSPTDSLNENAKVAYGIRPLYEIQTIASSGWAGGEDQWKETWNLNQNIYLKIADRSLAADTHQAGLYYSYIYFTLVTN